MTANQLFAMVGTFYLNTSLTSYTFTVFGYRERGLLPA